MNKTIIVIAGAAVLILLVCCGIGSIFIANAPKPDATTPVSPAATAGAPSANPKNDAPRKPAGIQEGEWLVGTDVAPGRYKTAGPAGDFMCYWQITTAPGATPGSKDFVTNDVPPGQAYVTLKKGQYFKTSHCLPWVKA